MKNEVENRPWGKFEVLLDEPQCKVKKITVNPGQQLSYQSHEHRSETWTVVKGMAGYTLNEFDGVLLYKDTLYIPQGDKHRIRNIGNVQSNEDMIFIEVQHSNKGIFDESDIIRYKDIYNRK